MALSLGSEDSKGIEIRWWHTGQSSSVGVPRARKVVFSWSISLSPGRYGIRSISSAKMHPTDHISTAEL